jgi:hypothetical protein
MIGAFFNIRVLDVPHQLFLKLQMHPGVLVHHDLAVLQTLAVSTRKLRKRWPKS